MTIPKQKQREAIFLALFSMDGGSDDEAKLVSLLMEELKMTMKNVYESLHHAKEVYLLKDELDEKITQASTAYEFDRIPRVEKNVLRLALFEMKTLPGPIAISEAIRLTRKFSTAESGSFVNAILDNLLKNESP
jgi:N utilization substance protein B